MTAYELLCDTNNEIIKGRTYTAEEKQAITRQLLSAASGRDAVSRFHKGVGAPDGGGSLYPLFYIPPYNGGKKLRLFTGELPKTHILSANHYELEVLRRLALWDADNPAVRHMLDATLKRLDATCFAHYCPTGECVGAGVCALRFLSAVRPRDDAWVDALLKPLLGRYSGAHAGMAATNGNIPVFYLYAALADIASGPCVELVESKKDWLIHMLTRGCLTGPAAQDTYGVMRLYVLKNALALLPEYAYMRDRAVYIAGKENRCYCDV